MGGGVFNAASGIGATVGGGDSNTASGLDATVGGGGTNIASGSNAAVAGGNGNTASGTESFVGGGIQNTAGGLEAIVGGGASNTASSTESTVSGGNGNTAGGFFATVPGADSNTAMGSYSFAAGRQAKANNHGAFVWADSQAGDLASTANNQFIARAAGHFFLQSDSTLDDQGGFLNTSTGGYLSTGGTWTNNSDENLKLHIQRIAPRSVLSEVPRLPISSWEYDSEPGVRHLGPMAQDFYRAFTLGADNRHIGSVDADGVSLAAIKALASIAHHQRNRLHDLRSDRPSG